MNTRKNPIIGIVVLLCQLAITFLSSAAVAAEGKLQLSPEQAAWIAGHPVIQVAAYDANWPPFEQFKGGFMRGLGPEYLEASTRRLGVEISYKHFVSWQAALAAACEGEVDLVLNLALTAERTHCLAYGKSYASAPNAIIGRLSDATTSLRGGLAGKTLVTEAEFVTAEQVRAAYPAARVMEAADTLEALRMVRDGRADYYVGNAYVATTLLARDDLLRLVNLGQSELESTEYHFGAPNKNRSLITALDAALSQMSQPEHRAIQARWLPTIEWPAVNSFDDHLPVRTVSRAPLRVGYPAALTPVSFTTEAGQPSGLVAEYLERLSSAGVLVDAVPVSSWSEVSRLARNGRVDALIGPGLEGALDRLGWQSSEPILSVPEVVITRVRSESIIDVGDLNGMAIVVSDPLHLRSAITAQAPKAKILEAPTAEAALARLAAGEVDAYVGNLAIAERILADNYSGVLQISAPFGSVDEIVFAASPGRVESLRQFDRMLSAISPREREAIRGDWLQSSKAHGPDWALIVRWAVPAGLICLFAGLILGVANHRLRREVGQRRLAENRLERVTETLPGVMYQGRRDADGTISFPFIAGDIPSLFGIPTRDAIKDERLLFARIHPDDRQRIAELLEGLASSPDPIEGDFRALTEGGWRWVRSRGQRQASDDDALVWSGYWIDVTDAHEQAEALRDAKRQAEQAGEAKATFLATMSHEIRTPMSGILGMLEMLHLTSLDERQRSTLLTIEESAQMLRQILDDILDFSKIEAGAMQLNLQPVSLYELVENTREVVSVSASAKGLTLETHIDPDVLDYYYCDQTRIRQILFNLLGNAVKFTAKGGIVVRLEVKGASGSQHELQLTVHDSGIGMSEEQQRDMFTPFSQAHSGTAQRFGGTGLGLSICHRLVSLMGGAISLTSRVGVGTTVCVSIPLMVSPVGPVPVLRPSARRWVNGERALVVEDHPTNQKLMKWRMEEIGFECVIAPNGIRGLQHASSERFDVIVTDCQMPEMDGYSMTRAIRAIESRRGSSRVPIIALTAGALSDASDLCLEAGMDAVLAKPVKLELLAQTLDVWLPAAGRTAEGFALDSSGSSTLSEDVRQYFGPHVALGELVATVVEEGRKDVAALRLAVAERRTEEVKVRLHRLAGSIGVLGAGGLVEEIMAAEYLLDAKGIDFSSDVIGALVEQVSGYVHYLDGCRAGLP